MQTKLVETCDGSHTLFVQSLNENYHSTHGAITESQHVFIHNGLLFTEKENVSILEVGFGTGLNALLTSITASKTKKKVLYTAIEKYPLPLKKIEKLNYPDILKISEEAFHAFYKASWNTWVEINTHFTLHKIKADWTSYILSEMYDIVYYDAFAPDVQPEMWNKERFEEIYRHLNIHGIITTYTVKGQVRRNLMAAGFEVEKLAGPQGGKKEILRAIKK